MGSEAFHWCCYLETVNFDISHGRRVNGDESRGTAFDVYCISKWTLRPRHEVHRISRAVKARPSAEP
jgi:hypothetical protein